MQGEARHPSSWTPKSPWKRNEAPPQSHPHPPPAPAQPQQQGRVIPLPLEHPAVVLGEVRDVRGAGGPMPPTSAHPSSQPQTMGALECSERGGAARPPCLAPEPLRRLNPSSHEPGGAQGLVSGRGHQNRDKEGKGQSSVLLFGLGPGMSRRKKNTQTALPGGVRAGAVPKITSLSLCLPLGQIPCARGRMPRDTPAPAPWPVHPQNH